jgi:hypothetical protein
MASGLLMIDAPDHFMYLMRYQPCHAKPANLLLYGHIFRDQKEAV